MSLISFLAKKFGGKFKISEVSSETFELYSEICYREMALWSAINLVANAISKCEFKTIYKGGELKGQEYYLWNVAPNQNQNSSQFIHKWISTLLKKNECLIVEINNKLYVADSFNRTSSALYDDVFDSVMIEDLQLNRKFSRSEVMYFKLSEKNMRIVSDALYTSYSKLMAYGMKSYKRSRGVKGVLKYNTVPVPQNQESEWWKEYFEKKINPFLEGENGVLPLGNGFDLQTFGGGTTYSNESSRDIRHMIDDISDFTAKAFGIPPVLLRGDTQDTEKAIDAFLTFCIDPLVDMLREEIVSRRIGIDGFTDGMDLIIDTKQIRHIDLLSVSTAVDKLIASGAFSINDIRKCVGELPINENWADRHYITKNYEDVENAGALGGEEL